jgi:hypothetical protein
MSVYRERLLGLLGKDDPFAVLEETPIRAAVLLERIGENGLSRPFGPGKWTAREVLGHLADVEQAIGFRVRQIVTAPPGHVIQPLDQDLWARPYGKLDPRAALRALEGMRAWNLTYFRTLGPEELARSGMHPERGVESAEMQIRMQAGHDRNHLAQLEKIADGA